MPPSCLSKCHPLCDMVALWWPGYKCSTLQSKVTRFTAHTQSRHVKKDARYSSDSVGGTSGLGRSQTSEQDEASFERQRREPLRGSGGMPHQKIWKSRGSEILFQAFSVAFFFRKSILGLATAPIGCENKWKCKSREVERWRPGVVPKTKGWIYWILK